MAERFPEDTAAIGKRSSSGRASAMDSTAYMVVPVTAPRGGQYGHGDHDGEYAPATLHFHPTDAVGRQQPFAEKLGVGK